MLMLDDGYQILDAGYQMLDAGSKVNEMRARKFTAD
jgi:hypothetical protein